MTATDICDKLLYIFALYMTKTFKRDVYLHQCASLAYLMNRTLLNYIKQLNYGERIMLSLRTNHQFPQDVSNNNVTLTPSSSTRQNKMVRYVPSRHYPKLELYHSFYFAIRIVCANIRILSNIRFHRLRLRKVSSTGSAVVATVSSPAVPTSPVEGIEMYLG